MSQRKTLEEQRQARLEAEANASDPISTIPAYPTAAKNLKQQERLRKRRQAKRTVLVILVAFTALFIFLAVKGCGILVERFGDSYDPNSEFISTIPNNEKKSISVGDAVFCSGYIAEPTDTTAQFDNKMINSSYAILINPSDNTIVAEKNSSTQISPASMTKVLTILVAAEQIKNMDATFEITEEIAGYSYLNDCSAVGFKAGEVISVRDLFYGTILPSGADAAIGLAIYSAGSIESFVALMNEKLDELGLSSTAHFTNCVGLYDADHYCTVYDIAIIMKAALENDFCREVLGTRTYTTSITEQHPEGIALSNLFIRRIEDKEMDGTVLGAKTGFVKQSGNCAVSYYVSNSNVPYIAVTANASGPFVSVNDHVTIYNHYTQ